MAPAATGCPDVRLVTTKSPAAGVASASSNINATACPARNSKADDVTAGGRASILTVTGSDVADAGFPGSTCTAVITWSPSDNGVAPSVTTSVEPPVATTCPTTIPSAMILT